ncbi:transmembrane protein 217B [Tenrec ecaudatus]|uniref:transmembrane protein 217B n=1 Tax=Tenrec ecaudatus TaxID=94439 RepID=UPI003F593DB0
MSSRKNCFIVGIFSVLNSIQFIIFQVKYVTSFGYKEDLYSIFKMMPSDQESWSVTHIKAFRSFLSTITIIVSCVLIYCVYRNISVGLLVYAIWIVLYEIINLSLVLLMKESIKKMFEELMYMHLVFQIIRMLLNLCCLPCVIKQLLLLAKDPKIVNKAWRRRHSSVSTMDSWSPTGLQRHHKLN